MAKIAERLRRAIRASGLSQGELARRTKITQPALNLFVNGRDIKLATAEKLFAFFGMNVGPPTKKITGGNPKRGRPPKKE